MKKDLPRLLYADSKGNIYDHPHLMMLVRKGKEVVLPRRDELIPLPQESNLFFLPGRRAMGFDPSTGEIIIVEEKAVSAFVCPGYTLTGICAYWSEKGAPPLPLFAYGAVGYMNGKLWVCASRVDTDKRQVFKNISNTRIKRGVDNLLKKYPQNRLISHLAKCALTYCCPAAKNLALGRYEAPIPTSRQCNARCIGCISLQDRASGFPSTQERIGFTPSSREIVELMKEHSSHEKRPIFSFGQGCEGEPLLEYRLIEKAISIYRREEGKGTININTNGSIARAIEPLARAGLTSLRISLNSGNPHLYHLYYRPRGYNYNSLRETMLEAKKKGLFVSINLLFFPGISDSEGEFEQIASLISDTHLDFIQLRNLNIDPEIYLSLWNQISNPSPIMGLKNFQKRLKKLFPWLSFGYFNPYLG